MEHDTLMEQSEIMAQEPQEQAVPQEQQPQQPSSSKEDNFRALRQAKERAERERDEALKILKQVEQSKKLSQETAQPDDEFDIGPDDIAEGKHLYKLKKTVKELQEQIKSYQHQSQESIIETKLKTQYNDFDKVVSRENVEALKAAYPEIAQSINASPDLYSKAVAAYTLIKKFGIYNDVSYDAEKERAHANASKPKPLASVSPQQGDSPLSRANAFANGLTEELRRQLYKEMLESRKGY